MLQRLRISTKLTILVAIPLASLVLLGMVAAQTLQQVRIGGDSYGKIIDQRNLLADVQPGPLLLLEAHLGVHRLASAAVASPPDPSDLNRIQDDLERLEVSYQGRQEFWTSTVGAEDTTGRALLGEAQTKAEAFWTAYRDDFLPTLRRVVANSAVDTTAVSASALPQELAALDQAYFAHRDTVTELVSQAEADLAGQEARANDMTRSQAMVLAGAGLAIIAIVAGIGLLVARSISRPIRALTDAANDAATSGLAEMVETVRDLPAGAELPALEPVAVNGGADITRLAASFDSLLTTAVGLAAGEAQLRHNVSAMFVNLGRRNQNLLNRTLNFITTLEQNERSPEALNNLFRLDHLVTRMRRNAESLLVMAGTDASRTWSDAVDIGDIVRGALSEIEAYERIEIRTLEAVEVRGNAAADVSHLLAEMLENATTFSPPSTDVTVVGTRCGEGYAVSVTDSGIGMTTRELEEANERLAEPAKFDSSPLMVLGLFVMSRLAHRHGIAVTLAAATGEGVTATIVLPHEMLEGTTPLPLEEAPAAPAVPAPGPLEISGPAGGGAAPPVTAAMVAAPLAAAAELPSPPRPPTAPEAPLPILASRPELDDKLGTDHGLTRRRRGAQMPDTGPDTTDAVEPLDPTRTPDAVRSALTALQGGQVQGRNIEPAAVALTSAASPAPAPDAPAPAPEVPAPEVNAPAAGCLTAGTVKEQNPTIEPALNKRVRGAQMFVPSTSTAPTGGGVARATMERPADQDRSADQVRSALASFQLGQVKAETETASDEAFGEGEG